MPEIEIELNHCWTLAFINERRGDDVKVWVCANKRAYDEALKHLQALPHIKVVQSGPSRIKEVP